MIGDGKGIALEKMRRFQDILRLSPQLMSVQKKSLTKSYTSAGTAFHFIRERKPAGPRTQVVTTRKWNIIHNSDMSTFILQNTVLLV